MRTLIILVLICCSLGCRPQPPKPVRSGPGEPADPVTAQRFEEAKRRVPSLRADLTDEQVFAALGLSCFYDFSTGIGGGPSTSYWMTYHIPFPNHALTVIRNMTGPKKILLRVDLDGVTWKPNETN